MIKEYAPGMEEAKEKAKKLLEASKQVKKEEQKQNLRKEASNFIQKAKEAKELIDELNLKRRNPWQAPPSTHFETVYNKKERVISELKPGQLKIEFTTNEALLKAGAGYLKIKIPIGDDKFID